MLKNRGFSEKSLEVRKKTIDESNKRHLLISAHMALTNRIRLSGLMYFNKKYYLPA